MNDGGPAFPQDHSLSFSGMSLRDYFAGQALIGILANTAEKYVAVYGTGRAQERVAGDAYLLADAMLAARDQSKIENRDSKISSKPDGDTSTHD